MPEPSDRPLTETVEFRLSSQQRHERAAEAFKERVRREEERARRAAVVSGRYVLCTSNFEHRADDRSLVPKLGRMFVRIFTARTIEGSPPNLGDDSCK